ncbi:MAG: PQQ-binding-like beta-propeller repeat protein [Prevotellaceae bacterium]|jgi:outer membrane protein assembly factor BamB/ferredoxin|nr:PQQ-binding-like beta-propeller repeat protein [Prevotellaceae bacterium]
MQIILNNSPVTVQAGETVLQAAQRTGYDIPTLCYGDGTARHRSSCMVCAVRNVAGGQIIPACTTIVTEGMQIDTESAEVQQVRRLSLELLLSDHRADCEAPCTRVCPHGLDIEEMLSCYDTGKYNDARRLIPAGLPCHTTCKAPCEKACRRGTVDRPVEIRHIISDLIALPDSHDTVHSPLSMAHSTYQSRLGRFTPAEKARLAATVVTPSRCLHCACAGRDKCRLRFYAGKLGISRPRYEASSALPVMARQQLPEQQLCYEASKCIRCGLCVYNSNDGFTFRDRGFGMQVELPVESRKNISPALAALCPTGALYKLRHLLPLFVILCLLAGLPASCALVDGFERSGSMDWHLFRGDPSLSGYTDTPLPEQPTLLWSYLSNIRTVSSPVVDGGTTYWCDRRGRVRGVDLSGQLVFDYDLHTTVEATPMIHDSALYIGRIDGVLTALSLTRADTLWNYATEGQISASPNRMRFADHDALVFGSYDNFMYCVDVQTGQLLNRFPSGYYLNGAAALCHNHVVFGGCDAWIRIIDCSTGLPTDSLKLDAYVPASPAGMGDYCYVGDYTGNIYKLLIEDGKIIRHRKIVSENDENGSFVAVPAVSDNTFYFFSGERHLYAVNRKNGSVSWKYLLKGSTGESSPVVCRDRLLVCTKTGVVSILDAADGHLLWEYDTGEQIVGSPAVIRGHFLVLTAKGTLLCFADS